MSTSSNPIKNSAARRASRPPTKVFKGHTRRVMCVASFPDRQHIASGACDKTVIIWDVKSGRQDGQPFQHDSIVDWIAISPDGRRIASGMEEGGLVVWDVLTREVVHEIRGDGVARLAYSPDGRWIATVPRTNEEVVRLWDATTGRPRRELLECDRPVWCVVFSPEGSRIAAGLGRGYFQVFDVSTGESVVDPIKGHTGGVWSIVYSPDGRLLVTASEDNSIRVWDSKTGIQVGKPMLGHEYGVRYISITADGRRIASGGYDQTVRIWDLETRLQVGHLFTVFGGSVAFSPDDRYIISDNGDDVCLWDTESLAIRGSSSPLTASKKNPPVRARAHPVTSSVLDLPAVPEPVVPHQDDSSPSESKFLHRPSFDSILDVPAVLEPGQQRPNKKRLHSPEPIHRRLRLTGPHQDPPRRKETSTVQPAASGSGSPRKPEVRARQQHVRHRQSRVPAGLPDGPPDVPLSLHPSANALASPECSPPTTSAWNAPIQDRTHPVTSSIFDGAHQAISRFCNALSNPQFSVSLAEAPNDWLRANSSQILQVPSIHGKDRVEVDMIYPRFFVYTLELLECYVPSEVESLKAKYIEWTNNVDEITQLINHESTMVTLGRYLAQRKTGFQLNDPAIVEKILKLDALSIVARILAILGETQRRRLLLGQRGPRAQSLLDLMQKLLDSFDLDIVRSFLVRILVELSKRSGLYPQRLVLPHIDIRGDQVAGGTFGDVWKGDLDGRAVAVKKMRVFDSPDVQALVKAYLKEAVLWAQLSSPYVLPFCGVYCADGPCPRACLVSPWMDNGNLPRYLKYNPKADRLQLMQDVALGLEYLHSFSLPVIHGDLKGLNVLITSGPRACIADFGLSIISEDSNIYFTATATSNGQGSTPWMAPELFDHINPERRRKSCASDIYAFGCVGYEIYAGRPPFSEYPPMMAFMRNLKLLRPASAELDDAIWELIEKCRDANPASRPSASEVVRQLHCHPGTRDYELAPLSVWHQKKGAT